MPLVLAPAAEAKPPVTASFAVTSSAPLTFQTVTFSSTSVVTGNGNTIVDHHWDLDGNGSFETDTGAGAAASRAYSQPGSVRVSLQVTDARGKIATASGVITIGNRPPKASFTFSPAAPVVFEPVTFRSTATDPEGRIALLQWDLNGDGIYDNGRGSTALRTFERAGSYVVGLEATDDAGGIAFFSRTVKVVPPSQPGQPVSPTSGPGSGLRMLNPFPVVRIAGRIIARGTFVRLLRIDAPAGSKVTIRCSGRGCPFAKKVSNARHRPPARLSGPQARTARRVRVRTLERLLRPGVIVRIFITRAEAIGKYTRFRIRRGAPPARVDRCLNPGSRRPIQCPVG